MVRKIAALLMALVVLPATSGCAGSIADWIVAARNNQGDVAMQQGNLSEASISYQLALKLDRLNEHARQGFSLVQVALAEQYYHNAKYDNARDALTQAAKYDPASVAVAELRSEIDQARLRRELVISNYPAYKEVGDQLLKSYEALDQFDATIIRHLKAFSYTYNVGELTDAIRESYEMNSELVKYTNRMATFRQLAESGLPDTERAAQAAGSPSLLPLP